ncbi:MAG: hypothetical protein WCI73_07425 [Phycisphaerae bacterium]
MPVTKDAMAKTPYIADDSKLTLEALRFLASPDGEVLRWAAAEARGEWTISQIEKYRRQYPAAMIHAALTLGAVQQKATSPKGKFAGMKYVWSPPEALEQATSLRLARHKAARIRTYLAEKRQAGDGVPGPQVFDYCAGIGGDALGMAETLRVRAVELLPVRAWCLEHNALELGVNAQLEVVAGDVLNLPVLAPPPLAAEAGGRIMHIDPARRSGGQRSHAWEDLIPGPVELERLNAGFEAGAIKLSPGVDYHTLPAGHVEVISEFGNAVQAVLWTGALGEFLGGNRQRTATVLGDGSEPWSITGTPGEEGDVAGTLIGGWVFEIDPAVHRCGLAGALSRQLGLAAVNTDGGYVVGPEMLDHPALTAFEVIGTVAYSEKRVAEALRDFAATMPASAERKPKAIEVKTRGGLGLDTDRLQKLWSVLPGGDCGVTVLIYRVARTETGGIQALLGRRKC